MSSDTPLQSSVKARLQNISREKNEDFQITLLRYVSERFLYRLGQSDHRDSFILKGAYLLTIILEENRYRTTKDIDFLKTGPTDSDFIKEAVREILLIPYPEDGIDFDIDSITIAEIREAQLYHGYRARVTAYLGKTRITLQLDIGIGDSVYPAAEFLSVPSLLDQDQPLISTYPLETVVAEKLEAIISIGTYTSRMKDFYDLYVILSTQDIDTKTVQNAIYATFERRGTPIPADIPEVLHDAVADDPTKQRQWNAFLGRIRSENESLPMKVALETIRNLAVRVFGLKET